MRNVLISDYDGTITQNDFYTLLAQRYIPAGHARFFRRVPAGPPESFQAMANYVTFTATQGLALEELLTATMPDPRFGAAVWYIEKVLARARVAATVYSNPGSVVAGRGLVLTKPGPTSRYYSEDVGIGQGRRCAGRLQRGEHLSFAGEGCLTWYQRSG